MLEWLTFDWKVVGLIPDSSSGRVFFGGKLSLLTVKNGMHICTLPMWL